MKATVNLSLSLVAFRLRCVIFFQSSYIIEHAYKKKVCWDNKSFRHIHRCDLCAVRDQQEVLKT